MQKETKGPSLALFCLVLVYLVITVPISTLNAQETTTSDNRSNGLKEAILALEERTGYRFFFVEEWLKGKTANTINANADMVTALEQLLADSDLNYFILEDEKRVILLQNTII